jgi:uncharacterized delta-60 repeat protein
MKNKLFWILAFGICLGFGIWGLGFVLVGCGHPLQQVNLDAPLINSVYPRNGATGIELIPVITATFDKSMDPSTINPITFTLSSAEGNVSGSVTYDAISKTASFIASGSLSFSTRYTAAISDQIKEAGGEKLESPYNWSFTTGSYITAVGTLDVSFSDGTHQGYGTYYDVSGGLIAGVAQGSQGESMILDSRGRILVTGKGRYQPNNSSDYLYNLAVWRIEPSGSLDNSFGNKGTFHSTFKGDEIGRSMIIDSSGKFIVTGDRYSNDLNNNGLAIWKLTPDGAVDEYFGTNGAIIYPPFDRGYSITLDNSDNIYVMGYSFGLRTKEGFSILRFKPDGTFDKTFDLTATPEGVVFRDETRTIAASGKTYVTGGVLSNTGDMAAWAYNSDGTPDTSFGANGRITFAGKSYDNEAIGKSVLVDAFGRIIIMGRTYPDDDGTYFGGGSEAMTVWRFK